MSKSKKNKLVLSIIIGAVSLILFGIFLFAMQTSLSVNSQHKDTKHKLSQMDDLLKNAENAAQQTTDTFDDIYKAKANSAIYIINNRQGFEYSTGSLKEISQLLSVTNIVITDKQGNRIAAAEDTAADFTYDRYNQLRTVFETGESSVPFEVKNGDLDRRYYGAKLDDNKMVIVEQDPKELNELLDSVSTWKSILGNVSVGLDGFAFAVSSKDYTFLYYPQEDMVGQDALNAGIDVTELEDNNYEWMTVNGERLYCGVSKMDDAYIICAVTESEIAASRNVTVAVVLFIFFAVLTLVILYAGLTIRDMVHSGIDKSERYQVVGGLHFDKIVGRKVGTVAIIGLVAVFSISFYMQTLFSLSRQSMSNTQHVKEVRKIIDTGSKNVEKITKEYDDRYLNKCRIAAYILSVSPELRTKPELEMLSDILDVEFVDVFDSNGAKTATSSMYTKFQISSDPKDQSYAFNNLLKGADYVIQKAQKDETSGEYRQYIGVALRDENEDASGFVQIAVKPSKLEEALQNTSISAVLKSVKVGADGFAFAVNKKEKTFAYYPEEKLIGRKAANYGMEESQFRDEYSNYITISGKKYFGSAMETDDYYIYTVVPVSEMTNSRGTIALISVGASFVCLAIIFVLLTFSKKQEKTKKKKEGNEDGPMIDIEMPDGTIRKTEAVTSRWANISIDWEDKTPEQQIFSVLKVIFGVFALAITFAVVFREKFISTNSIFLYVLDGKWERGVNIFAVTACFMIVCVISMLTMVIKKVLQVLAGTFGARGETVCRLLSSFAKYASVIAMLYYCLALVGVDTKTLLASAGILTLVVGLGARTLVSDILAGLFIIFEGEFRVGDIVTIGDCRGTVLEIGIRTTKIENGSKDIKVISNSNVSGVVNMTKNHSFAICDIGIEYGESLENVEQMLKKELSGIKQHLPSIQVGPEYNGVMEIGGTSVTIRISAQCAEKDRIQLGRDLKREMKLLFDKHGIKLA